MLEQQEQRKAKRLFEAFFQENPGAKNPTDINTKAKFDYAVRIGWESLHLMQKARKINTRKNGYPYPWTHADHFRTPAAVDPVVTTES